MTVPVARTRSGETVAAAQIYYTHCLAADSLDGNGGYNIRAASTREDGLLRFVRGNFSYLLPMELWGEGLKPEQAPWRLAWVPEPGGRMALAHTAYLSKSTDGRPNSFFSHALITAPGAASAAEALRTWASPDWTVSYESVKSKDLETRQGLPRPGPVCDQAVTDFLTGARATEQDLARLVCPQRLLADPARRRALLRQVLAGCLLALLEGPDAPRNRLYVLAEPGLTALLLYAAARLLPEPVGTGLTFSTYENIDKALREYRLARVVGTFTSTPQQTGLSPEYYKVRGFAVDTFSGQGSPELCGRDVPAGIDRLLDLAAEGAWKKIDEAYRALGAGPKVVEAFPGALALLEARARLLGRKATEQDLFELRAASGGPEFLEEHAAATREAVRRLSLGSKRLAQEFSGLLRECQNELMEEAGQVLKGNDPNWEKHWRRLEPLLKGGSAPEVFRKLVVPAVGSVIALRFPLLAEWHRLNGDELHPKLEGLLAVANPEGLAELARADLPQEWRSQGLHQAILRRPTWLADLGVLLRESQESGFLNSYWRTRMEEEKANEQRLLLLHLLPKANAPRNRPVMEELFRGGCRIDPQVVHEALERIRAYDVGWLGFWLKDQYLPSLLQMLPPDGRSTPVWDRIAKLIDKKLLVEHDEQQRQLLTDLWTIANGCFPAVRGRDSAIADWCHLLEPFEGRQSAGSSRPDLLREACKRRGFKWDGLLSEYFLGPSGPYRSTENLESFLTIFNRFHGDDVDPDSQTQRLLSWLSVVAVCPATARLAECQLYFFRASVNEGLQKPLAKRYKDKLQPSVVEEVLTAAPPPSEAPMIVPEARTQRENDWNSSPEEAVAVARRADFAFDPEPANSEGRLIKPPEAGARGKRKRWFGWRARLVTLAALTLLGVGAYGGWRAGELLFPTRDLAPAPPVNAEAGAAPSIWDKKAIGVLLTVHGLHKEAAAVLGEAEGAADRLPDEVLKGERKQQIVKLRKRLKKGQEAVVKAAATSEKTPGEELKKKLDEDMQEGLELCKDVWVERLGIQIAAAEEAIKLGRRRCKRGEVEVVFPGAGEDPPSVEVLTDTWDRQLAEFGRRKVTTEEEWEKLRKELEKFARLIEPLPHNLLRLVGVIEDFETVQIVCRFSDEFIERYTPKPKADLLRKAIPTTRELNALKENLKQLRDLIIVKPDASPLKEKKQREAAEKQSGEFARGLKQHEDIIRVMRGKLNDSLRETKDVFPSAERPPGAAEYLDFLRTRGGMRHREIWFFVGRVESRMCDLINQLCDQPKFIGHPDHDPLFKVLNALGAYVHQNQNSVDGPKLFMDILVFVCEQDVKQKGMPDRELKKLKKDAKTEFLALLEKERTRLTDCKVKAEDIDALMNYWKSPSEKPK